MGDSEQGAGEDGEGVDWPARINMLDMCAMSITESGDTADIVAGFSLS